MNTACFDSNTILIIIITQNWIILLPKMHKNALRHKKWQHIQLHSTLYITLINTTNSLQIKLIKTDSHTCFA